MTDNRPAMNETSSALLLRLLWLLTTPFNPVIKTAKRRHAVRLRFALLLSLLLPLHGFAAEALFAEGTAVSAVLGDSVASALTGNAVTVADAASNVNSNVNGNAGGNADNNVDDVDGNVVVDADADADADATTDADASKPTDTPKAGVKKNAPVAGNLTQKDSVIATNPDQVNDADIKRRIQGIFSEIEGLQAIVVNVNEGVVSLSGEAPNEKKAQQALHLANRLSDVVTVEDRISRTLDVQDNLTPMLDGLKQQAQALIKAAPLLLVAILLFSLVVWLGGWLSRRSGLWQRITPNPFVADLLSQTVKVAFIILGLIAALSLIGAEALIGTLLGGAGVIGIAVGFAVKDTIENYIASLMLSIRQPFQARDSVQINDKSGIVVRLTSRATILMTMEGNQLRIPNSEVFKATILNYSKNPERRFTFQLGVDANDDPIAAIKVGLNAINALDFVLKDPKAIAIITEVGDSNIVLEFQVWVNQTDTDLYKARSIAIRQAKHELEDKGFSLPEPIYKVRFNNDVEEALKQFNTVQNRGHMHIDTNLAERPMTEEQAYALQDNEAQQQVKTQKNAAKLRAKHILDDGEGADVLDARPDPKLMQKVEAEIQENAGDTDLLDGNSPQE